MTVAVLWDIFITDRGKRVDKRAPGYENQSNPLTGSCRPIANTHLLFQLIRNDYELYMNVYFH